MRGALIVFVLGLSACGGSPNAPSATTGQIPNVVGNYTGNTDITLPELGSVAASPVAIVACT